MGGLRIHLHEFRGNFYGLFHVGKYTYQIHGFHGFIEKIKIMLPPFSCWCSTFRGIRPGSNNLRVFSLRYGYLQRYTYLSYLYIYTCVCTYMCKDMSIYINKSHIGYRCARLKYVSELESKCKSVSLHSFIVQNIVPYQIMFASILFFSSLFFTSPLLFSSLRFSSLLFYSLLFSSILFYSSLFFLFLILCLLYSDFPIYQS